MPLSRKALILFPVILCSIGSLVLADGPLTDWWATDAETAVGDRQRIHSGKQWPLAPRPGGPRQPFVHRYHSSLYWPDPYRWDDRGSVRTALAAQRVNGWITATTLYGQHFDPLTSQINEAGKIHLRWILLHTPPDRRLTWVAAGDDPQTSQVRLASVQEEACLIAGRDVPPIMLRVCQSPGNAADEADMIRRSYMTSIPVPRVPYVPLTSGAGGGGGANPQGGGATPQAGAGR